MAEGKTRHIIASLKLQDHNITHAFLVGSRLWGTNTGSSDFDLLFIAETLSSEVPKSQHKNQYDITLLTKDEFTRRLKSGSLIETVCCLVDGDEESVWRTGGSLKRLVPDIAVLEAWVAARQGADCDKAKKFWLKGKKGDAFKILQHMIMAEYVVRALRGKAQDAGGRLNDVSLEVAELRAFVREGRDKSDRDWMDLEWAAVEALHTVRLQRKET
ncbi:hypothetical protein Hypma_008632 [Hypsizygus marmoreus]|uniref:Uncharacterized protein n=1 Tax=Hypsizygus marmoreus TaxID=39966 RepID=A0A369JQA3_HYPMA|nr:hypothetical protein Hypma_008632 [Hypsizygus marmoreus]